MWKGSGPHALPLKGLVLDHSLIRPRASVFTLKKIFDFSPVTLACGHVRPTA